ESLEWDLLARQRAFRKGTPATCGNSPRPMRREALNSRNVRGGVSPLQGLQARVRFALLDTDQQSVDDPAEVGIGARVVEAADGHAEPVAPPDGARKSRNLTGLLPHSLNGFSINGSFTHALRVGFYARAHKLRFGGGGLLRLIVARC